jgi:hypothetical protein
LLWPSPEIRNEAAANGSALHKKTGFRSSVGCDFKGLAARMFKHIQRDNVPPRRLNFAEVPFTFC